jgi:predicted PurR-regulated permease PerM
VSIEGLLNSAQGDKSLVMAETARRAFVATVVDGTVIVLALALWELKVVVFLIFLAFTVSAAMRPGVEALQRRRVPRGVGVLLHYVVLAALLGLFLWLVVPRALSQVDHAIRGVPTTQEQLGEAAQNSKGVKHEVLLGLQKRLQNLPRASEVVRPALTITITAFEILVAIFFVFAAAAYWIFERDRAIDYVCQLLPRPKRKIVRDTWHLIDLKLGSYVRGQALLIVIVGTILSLAFWAIGLPYWLLLGAFGGVVEIVPVIGPLAAGALAVGVVLTKSVGVAIAAGVIVLAQRQLEDYLLAPRILGGAVGLSPLLVMISVFASGILFGPVAVILAIPAVAVLTTLVDVIVRDKDPAAEEVPTVLFPAKEADR